MFIDASIISRTGSVRRSGRQLHFCQSALTPLLRTEPENRFRAFYKHLTPGGVKPALRALMRLDVLANLAQKRCSGCGDSTKKTHIIQQLSSKTSRLKR